jgi:uncharacterized protein (TIGR02217 family)
VTAATAPALSVVVTADFQFHIPVRFDVDDMSGALVEESDVVGGNALITWPNVNLVEVRI